MTEKERSAIREYELKPWDKQSGKPTGKTAWAENEMADCRLRRAPVMFGT